MCRRRPGVHLVRRRARYLTRRASSRDAAQRRNQSLEHARPRTRGSARASPSSRRAAKPHPNEDVRASSRSSALPRFGASSSASARTSRRAPSPRAAPRVSSSHVAPRARAPRATAGPRATPRRRRARAPRGRGAPRPARASRGRARRARVRENARLGRPRRGARHEPHRQSGPRRVRARARRGEGVVLVVRRALARVTHDRGLRQKRRRDFHGRRGIPIFIIAIRIRRGEKRAYALEIVQRFKRLRLRRRVARTIGLGAGSFFHALRRANACRDGAKRVSSLLGDGAFFRADFRSRYSGPVPAPRSRAAFPRSRNGPPRPARRTGRGATRRPPADIQSSKTVRSSRRSDRVVVRPRLSQRRRTLCPRTTRRSPSRAPRSPRPTRRPARRTPRTPRTRRIRRVRRVRRVFHACRDARGDSSYGNTRRARARRRAHAWVTPPLKRTHRIDRRNHSRSPSRSRRGRTRARRELRPRARSFISSSASAAPKASRRSSAPPNHAHSRRAARRDATETPIGEDRSVGPSSESPFRSRVPSAAIRDEKENAFAFDFRFPIPRPTYAMPASPPPAAGRPRTRRRRGRAPSPSRARAPRAPSTSRTTSPSHDESSSVASPLPRAAARADRDRPEARRPSSDGTPRQTPTRSSRVSRVAVFSIEVVLSAHDLWARYRNGPRAMIE